MFAGQEIRNGDRVEILPDHQVGSYVGLSAIGFRYLSSYMQHVDHYSRTKSIAERLVMGACGAEVKGQRVGLKTCSLRCAGIYGEGERRHLPRIVVIFIILA